MELERLKLEVVTEYSPVLLSSMVIQPKLLERIKNARKTISNANKSGCSLRKEKHQSFV